MQQNQICLSTSNYKYIEFRLLLNCNLCLEFLQCSWGNKPTPPGSIFAAPHPRTVSIPHRRVRNWPPGLPAPGPEQDCREPIPNGPARPEAGCPGDGRRGQPGYLQRRLPWHQHCSRSPAAAAATAAHVLLEWRLPHEAPASPLCKRKARMMPHLQPPIYIY